MIYYIFKFSTQPKKSHFFVFFVGFHPIAYIINNSDTILSFLQINENGRTVVVIYELNDLSKRKSSYEVGGTILHINGFTAIKGRVILLHTYADYIPGTTGVSIIGYSIDKQEYEKPHSTSSTIDLLEKSKKFFVFYLKKGYDRKMMISNCENGEIVDNFEVSPNGINFIVISTNSKFIMYGKYDLYVRKWNGTKYVLLKSIVFEDEIITGSINDEGEIMIVRNGGKSIIIERYTTSLNILYQVRVEGNISCFALSDDNEIFITSTFLYNSFEFRTFRFDNGECIDVQYNVLGKFPSCDITTCSNHEAKFLLGKDDGSVIRSQRSQLLCFSTFCQFEN